MCEVEAGLLGHIFCVTGKSKLNGLIHAKCLGNSKAEWVQLTVNHCLYLFILKILFIFRERGRVGEREGEKHQSVLASRVPPTGNLACNSGMCADGEWNQ